MRREFIDKLNNTKIGIYVNREASGVDEDEELMQRGNDIYESKDVAINYDTDDKNERYDIVHAVIDKVILKRDEKYQLCITIYNKVNNEVKELTYNCFKKKFT